MMDVNLRKFSPRTLDVAKVTSKPTLATLGPRGMMPMNVVHFIRLLLSNPR